MNAPITACGTSGFPISPGRTPFCQTTKLRPVLELAWRTSLSDKKGDRPPLKRVTNSAAIQNEGGFLSSSTKLAATNAAALTANIRGLELLTSSVITAPKQCLPSRFNHT